MLVVGISGKSGVGKDYTYQHLLRPVGFRNWSFAWHLKVGIVGRGQATHEQSFIEKPDWLREQWQQEGTERGWMVHGKRLWVDTAFEWMRLLSEEWGQNRFVIPDVRYPHELEGIQALGGKVVRIEAPERAALNRLTPEQRLHSSEIALDGLDTSGEPAFDALLYNDPGDEIHHGSLEYQLEEIFDGWDWIDVADQLYALVGRGRAVRGDR